MLRIVLAVVVALAVAPLESIAAGRQVSADTRRDMIRRARIWAPTDIPAMDLRSGPQDGRGFAPDATVTCSYRQRPRPHGHSPKFDCALPDGSVVTVKFGRRDPEVYAEVLATRLLWALGFGADAMYPAAVICRGCAANPWRDSAPVADSHTFDPAMIERPMKGHRTETGDRSGWSWPELDLVDQRAGGATVAERDALKLLAVLLQHTDTARAQQRLVCLDHGWTPARTCEHPFMYLHDVGLTFGSASMLNLAHTAGMNFRKWSGQSIWKNPDRCVGNLEKSVGGTLGNPTISEAGRAFLANLLGQLTDRQVEDLFAAARVERYSTRATADDWVAAFKEKRAQIVNHHCP